MRIRDLVLPAVLATGLFLAAIPAPCRAEAAPSDVAPLAVPPLGAASAAPQPGTDDEERAYARRESESPGVRDFAGGQVVEILLIVALVLVIILLVREV